MSTTKNAGRATKKRKRISLLDLPPELWTYICEMAVTQVDAIKAFSKLGSRQNELTVMQPGISRTCRQLRRHTIPIFYETNTFIAYNQMALPKQLVSWLNAIGWTNRARLHNLFVKGGGTHTFEEIEEHCIDVGITLPFWKTITKPELFTGSWLYQLSFVELDATPDEQTTQ